MVCKAAVCVGQVTGTVGGMQQRNLQRREQTAPQAGLGKAHPLAEKPTHIIQAWLRPWQARETKPFVNRKARFFHCPQLLEKVGPDIELQR